MVLWGVSCSRTSNVSIHATLEHRSGLLLSNRLHCTRYPPFPITLKRFVLHRRVKGVTLPYLVLTRCIHERVNSTPPISLFPDLVCLTPKVIITRSILKKTRKITLLAKARGMIPKNVVTAPSITEGPTSPMASAMRASLGILGSYSVPEWNGGKCEGRQDISPS